MYAPIADVPAVVAAMAIRDRRSGGEPENARGDVAASVAVVAPAIVAAAIVAPMATVPAAVVTAPMMIPTSMAVAAMAPMASAVPAMTAMPAAMADGLDLVHGDSPNRRNGG